MPDAAVSGITSSDWLTIYNRLMAEYNEVGAKHKRPTEYMRGIVFAIEVLDSIRPYNIVKEN